jgi:hypothetical protein
VKKSWETNQPATEPSRERPAAETRREIRRESKDGSKVKNNEDRMKRWGARGELNIFVVWKVQIVSTRLKFFEINIGKHGTQTKNISENFKIQDQQDTGAWDWKSNEGVVLKERVNHDIALSSERDEVDRKKRHAADTTHFLFDSIYSLEKTSYPRGVLFIREIALDKSE